LPQSGASLASLPSVLQNTRMCQPPALILKSLGVSHYIIWC
jgi:hypothetical protein